MNVPQQATTDETNVINEIKEPPPQDEALSPFTGLVTIGQLVPINGVWCRVAKYEGPHIILTATGYTSKIKRLISNAQNAKKKKTKKC